MLFVCVSVASGQVTKAGTVYSAECGCTENFHLVLHRPPPNRTQCEMSAMPGSSEGAHWVIKGCCYERRYADHHQLRSNKIVNGGIGKSVVRSMRCWIIAACRHTFMNSCLVKKLPSKSWCGMVRKTHSWLKQWSSTFQIECVDSQFIQTLTTINYYC